MCVLGNPFSSAVWPLQGLARWGPQQRVDNSSTVMIAAVMTPCCYDVRLCVCVGRDQAMPLKSLVLIPSIWVLTRLPAGGKEGIFTPILRVRRTQGQRWCSFSGLIPALCASHWWRVETKVGSKSLPLHIFRSKFTEDKRHSKCLISTC